MVECKIKTMGKKIISSEKLLFVFGVSVSAVERHKARTVDIERVVLNGIMTYEICTEISGQCLISICDDIFQ